jgi:hypothetical protein
MAKASPTSSVRRQHWRSGARPPDIEPSSMSTQVVRMLRDTDMPIAEIRAIATADGPAIAHRYIELHAERLVERLGEQLEILRAAELLLMRAMHTGNVL